MTAETAWALIDKKTGEIAYRYDFTGHHGVVVCNLAIYKSRFDARFAKQEHETVKQITWRVI